MASGGGSNQLLDRQKTQESNANDGMAAVAENFEKEKEMLQLKIQTLETRIQMSEETIRESSKKYNKEIAALKRELAEKDAKIEALIGGN